MTNPAVSNLPRVVIDWDDRGNHRVFADPGVVIYDRATHLPDDALYRYAPPPIPSGWTDGVAGYKGDGSKAEQRLVGLVSEHAPREGK
ncbi:MAG: hypothetical protein AAFQ18_10515 [Pseudomonadota bacterium]